MPKAGKVIAKTKSCKRVPHLYNVFMDNIYTFCCELKLLGNTEHYFEINFDLFNSVFAFFVHLFYCCIYYLLYIRTCSICFESNYSPRPA